MKTYNNRRVSNKIVLEGIIKYREEFLKDENMKRYLLKQGELR